MTDISYIQVEQGMKILDLKSALTTEKEAVASLTAQVEQLKSSQAIVSSLEQAMERQRLELLAAQRTAQLAETALEKAQRELPALKSKLNEADKERKLLKGLNPERLKRNLAEQKRKTDEAKAAVSEWKQRTKEARDDHKAEIRDVQTTLLQMLEERDYFAEIDGYRLTLSRFKFPHEAEDSQSTLRIRVINTETSESCVVQHVNEQEEVILPSNMTCPDSVLERIRLEWKSLLETGKVLKESSEEADLTLS